jgi:mitochondrial fission protein ELM1
VALDPSGDALAPPWPRLVVGCGRRSIGPTLMVKRLSGGRTVAAYVQNPEWGRRRFDLVAAMPHDGVTGPNVVIAPTAVHGVTESRLAEARATWRQRLNAEGGPSLGVLVGGDNGGYRLTPKSTDRLVRVLRDAYIRHGMRSLVTPSRRTSDDAKRRIANALATDNLGWIWDQRGDNPYFGILALADRLIVTADSISMVSEALATGRPVHVLPLEGNGRRHDAFLKGLVADRLVSLVQGDDLDWKFTGRGPVDSTAEPAGRLREMLKHSS